MLMFKVITNMIQKNQGELQLLIYDLVVVRLKSTYYVNKANTLVVTKESYLEKFDLVSKIKENGLFILNTNKNKDEVLEFLSNKNKNILKNNKIKFYIIDASK